MNGLWLIPILLTAPEFFCALAIISGILWLFTRYSKLKWITLTFVTLTIVSLIVDYILLRKG